MGGTGGPGSDRAAAQTGLQGAGLLAGGTAAPSATLASLGVEGPAQPSTAALSGSDGAIAPPAAATSLTDTGASAVPAADAPNGYIPPPVSTVDSPMTPASGFTPAGGNLGFPLGQFGAVPYGQPNAPTEITGPAVTGAPIAAAPASAAAGPEYEFDMAAWMADAAAYNKANAAWGKPALRSDAFPGPKTYQKLKGT